jgi:hypothetical protein
VEEEGIEMTDEQSETTSDDILAAALAYGATHHEAGEKIGLSERTVRRRLENPGFRARVSKERTLIVRQISDGLTGLTLQALETLQSLLEPSVPAPCAAKLHKACLARAESGAKPQS